MGELAVDHESAVRYQALIASHRPRRAPANAAAGAWVPAELGAASGEPPVDTTASGNSGYMDTPVGSIAACVQDRLRKMIGHGKRLIVQIDLPPQGVNP